VSDEERLSRLEHRLEVLEALVRQLAAGRPAAPPATGLPAVSPRGEPGPPVPPPEPRRPPPPPPPPAKRGVSSLLSEQWLGQRGLLAVGVVFVVLAAGYLLKLSFDRGWISPLVRCVGGTVAGLAVSALGWRLHGRGFRTYGAALIGCGAAIMYLAVWAAARLYEFLSVTPAIGALALVSLGLAAVAFAIDVEALGATAALGAFFAPIVVGKEAGSVNLLLVYLGAVGAGLGTVSARRHWRVATLVVALSYFGIASSGILRHAAPAALYLYGIAGGSAGLFVGLREGWLETRLLAFAGGWAVLGVANGVSHAHWPTLIGGAVLATPVWWRALTAGAVWPGAPEGVIGRHAFSDSFYFYLSVPLLVWALHEVAPARFDAAPGLAWALIGGPYLAVGLSRRDRTPFSLVAAATLVIAAFRQWSGLEAAWACLALTQAWALSDHLLRRRDGGWYSLGCLTVALWHFLLVDLPIRPSTEAAFLGPWALTLYLTIETAATMALGLLRAPDGRPIRGILWGIAGLLLLFGLTGEIIRAFDQSGFDPIRARLAGGLSVSAWWICCAAACFVVGFRRRIRTLRLAGFAVAGLALLKVVFVDLSELDALYRVGSAFILGVVSLAVAYAYHRAAGQE
jgi:uncharacterized membrane protein